MARLIPVNGNEAPMQPAQGSRFQITELEQLVGSHPIATTFLNDGTIMIIVRDGKRLGMPGNGAASMIWATDQGEIYTSDRLVGPVIIISRDELPEVLLRSTLDSYYAGDTISG